METYKLSSLYSSLQIMDIQLDLVETNWSCKPHSHSYFEYIYCKSGKIQQLIDNHTYILSAGTSIFIPSRKIHKTMALEPSEYLVFHFDIEALGIYSLFSQISNPFVEKDMSIKLNVTFKEWFEKLITDFKIQSHKKTDKLKQKDYIKDIDSSISNLFLQSRIFEFISLLANYFYTNEDIKSTELSSSEIEIANKATQFLDDNCTRSITMNELSDYMSFHRSYISTVFKKAHGLSPTEYIAKIRMKEAAKLLTTTEKTIEEISINLNFNSSAHLSQMFKSIYGTSPSQFRKQYTFVHE
jgi:AraC-like DNA-binding protein